MQLPIYSYGNFILRKKCKAIDNQYPDLENLIQVMWETLYRDSGCGLAAPQIGKSIKLFLVDSKMKYDNLSIAGRRHYFDKNDTGVVKTFINAEIIEYSKETWIDEEGCLSIPHLSAKVERPWSITIEYIDKKFRKRKRRFSGATARMIQHEYDHTQGILFLDYLDDLTKKRFEHKLTKISAGHIQVRYPMIFKKSPLPSINDFISFV